MDKGTGVMWYVRLLATLAHVINRPFTPERARAMVLEQMATRAQRFLTFIRQYVYGHSRSPYLPLLEAAGIEHGGLATMVQQQGVEGTLATLRDAGVYLSFEEFKGRADVVRNGRTFRFTEQDFDNPFAGAGMDVRTGGSRSRGSAVSLGLKFVEENVGPALHLALLALDAVNVPPVIWLDGFAAAAPLIGFMNAGHPPARWFSLHDPSEPTVKARIRMLPTIAGILSWPRGIKVPKPEFAPVSAAERVLTCILRLRDQRGGCSVLTFPNSAVRLAELAQQRGASLEHVAFLLAGEPLTPGKAEEIRRAGARAGSLYGFTEGGAVGVPCADPQAVDDMHLLAHNFALIRHRRTIPEVCDLNAYMFTSLAATPPKILLNVEIDDFGELSERRCRCPLDELGLHQHFATVRSFTKLTGEGSTILGTDCVRILEEVLPREFGGRSIDYQLLEAEDEHHLTRLLLLVSPDLGAVDEHRVRQRFIDELRRRAAKELRLWRQAETIQVVRRHPLATPRGKMLPFHTQALAAFLGAGQPSVAAPVSSGERPVRAPSSS